MTDSTGLTTNKKAKSTSNYFDVEQENAVSFLLVTTWDERNVIYNQWLKGLVDKMIDSIIRRYKLYRKGMDYRDIHSDTHSFLMTKIEKFKPDKNKSLFIFWYYL